MTGGTHQIAPAGGPPSLARQARKLAFIVLTGVLYFFTLNNLFVFWTDTAHGDMYADQFFPAPEYRLMRIPPTKATLQHEGANRLGADFAQIYFPAQDIRHLQNAYDPKTTLDPFERPSRYAPLIHFLWAVTFCRLEYGHALLLHILLQIVLFTLLLYYTHVSLGIRESFFPSLLLMDFCLFLTSGGLSWLERGQFSLYVAASYLALLLGLLKEKPALIVFSAFLAFIKWTSFPVAFVILAVYLFNSRTAREFRRSLFYLFLFGLTIAIQLVFFIKTDVLFINGLIDQELHYAPDGISLARLVPRYLVKWLPAALIVLGFVSARWNKKSFAELAPYLTGAAVILLLYPTLAFDYSVPTLFGLVPLMIFWARRSGAGPPAITSTILYLFLTFLAVAPCLISFTDSKPVLVSIYVAMTVVLVASPSILARYSPRQSPATPLS